MKMQVRRAMGATLAVASLSVGLAAFAPTAGAQADASVNAGKDQVCQRAHDDWVKLVAANQRAVDEYHRLRAKQQMLLANHHDVAAHRLDAALDAVRRRHEVAKAKVLAVAAKVKAFCTEQPPVLAEP